MDNTIKRRLFIRGAAAFVTAMGINKISASEHMFQNFLDTTFFINPAFTIDSTAAGNTVLRTNLGFGKIKELTFTGIENDIIKMLKRHSTVRSDIQNLAVLHNLGEKECEERCSAVMARLVREGIIVNKESDMNIIQNVYKRPSE